MKKSAENYQGLGICKQPMGNSYLPYVSVIIPVYNGRLTLSECLESVKNLDYPNDRLEVIVVDNGSKDGSDKIAEKYGAKVLYETSIQSPGAARNKGIIEAKGELIAFTDSDCVVTMSWLKHLVKYWDDNQMGCFAGKIEAYTPSTIVEKYSKHVGMLNQEWTLHHQYLPYTQTANSAYRKYVFDQIGLFNTEMIAGEDGDLAWRMQRKLNLRIKYIPEALVYHKHRSTIRGLYKQFKGYEMGTLIWKKYYPDYPLPSVGQRYLLLQRSIITAIRGFPLVFKKVLMGQVDASELCFPFLNIITNLGKFRGRLWHI